MSTSSSAAPAQPSAIKLHYFNGVQRGELIRYILTYAEVPFVDNRIAISDWFSVKNDYPLGQLPVLEYTDAEGSSHKLAQSCSIARTCARWFNLAGETDHEKSEADEAFESMRDLLETATKAAWEPDTQRKETLLNQTKTEVFPRTLAYLEQKLTKNGGIYIAGGKSFTYADFNIAVLLDHLGHDMLVIPNVGCRPAVIDLDQMESNFPGLAQLKKRVEQLPSIKNYLTNRPQTTF